MLDLYVSNNGNDRNCGTFENPFATVEAARDAIRAMPAEKRKEAITVHILEGEYFTGSIVFDERDSGTEEYPITYRGEGEVLITGGLLLRPEDFTDLTEEERERLPGDARDHVVRADLKKLGITADDWGGMCTIGGYSTGKKYDDVITSLMSCELTFQNKRMITARYPNEGYVYVDEVVKLGDCLVIGYDECPQWQRDPRFSNAEEWKKQWWELRNPKADMFKVDPETAKRVAKWKNIQDAWIFGYPWHAWADASTPLKHYNAETRALETAHVSMWGIHANAPYYFYNVLEELDVPGEWYLDRQKGVLYFYPPEDLTTGQTRLSLLDQDIIALKNARYINFEHITFSETRANAMKLEGDHITVSDCEIRNVAENAIVIDGNHCTIQRCHIHNTGKSGVKVNGGDRCTLTSGENLIDGNHFHHLAQLCPCYEPAVYISGVGATVSNNHIHDLNHMAIWMVGANNNIIEYNEVHDVCLYTEDASAIYQGRDYTCYGNVIRYNYFHDIKSAREASFCGVFAVYADDNSAGLTIEHNVFLRCQGVLLLHGGHDMVFSHNFIQDAQNNSKYAISFRKYDGSDLYNDNEPHPQSTHWIRENSFQWDRALWYDAYPHLKEYTTWEPDSEQIYPHYCDISNNLIVNHKGIYSNFEYTNPIFQNKVENNQEING